MAASQQAQQQQMQAQQALMEKMTASFEQAMQQKSSPPTPVQTSSLDNQALLEKIKALETKLNDVQAQPTIIAAPKDTQDTKPTLSRTTTRADSDESSEDESPGEDGGKGDDDDDDVDGITTPDGKKASQFILLYVQKLQHLSNIELLSVSKPHLSFKSWNVYIDESMI